MVTSGDEGIRTFEIADALEESPATVSKGLRMLEQVALVNNIVRKHKTDGIESRYFPTRLARKLSEIPTTLIH